MAKNFYQTIIASGGFAGEDFDVAAGPINTGIIDVLLSTGDGILTEEAPVSIKSTGVLGAARELDITAIEQDGRFFFLSVENGDIGANNLTVTATTDINGGGVSLVISSIISYIFIHQTGGIWKAYPQSQTISSGASVFRGTIASGDWTAGTPNRVIIIQAGVPAAGEIGPHGLSIASSYAVQFYRDSDDQLINVGVEVDTITGDITLRKTGLGPNSAGRVIVVGT